MPKLVKFIISVSIAFALTGCSADLWGNLPPTLTASATPTIPSLTPIPPTDTPTLTPTETLTPTATVTLTPTWIFQSGSITCPILLYHHIEEPPSDTSSSAVRYYTSPEDFRMQMQALHDWGYTTIPISLLVQALLNGATLPPRPVVITFDDGYSTVAQNAYPIMQSYGFVGVVYYITNALNGAPGYMTVDQLNDMIKHGWEVGSHSMNHPDLTKFHDQLYVEGAQSLKLLRSALGVDISTFAYPYGQTDSFVTAKIAEYGYLAAVGLGTSYIHDMSTLYYLSRIEVHNGTDLQAFAAMLPWSGQP